MLLKTIIDLEPYRSVSKYKRINFISMLSLLNQTLLDHLLKFLNRKWYYCKLLNEIIIEFVY